MRKKCRKKPQSEIGKVKIILLEYGNIQGVQENMIIYRVCKNQTYVYKLVLDLLLPSKKIIPGITLYICHDISKNISHLGMFDQIVR